MDINVRLYGEGSGNGRQSKLSGKETAHKTRKVISQSSGGSNLRMVKKTGNVAKGVMSGSASKVMAGVPILATIFAGLHLLDRFVNFGAGVYQAWSGEDMFASNVRAYSKTVSSAGLNLLVGSIKNELYVKPRITRENYMRDYGRDLYTRVGYNVRNDLT